MKTIEDILKLIPKDTQIDIGTNVLGESTLLVLKKDNRDFRAEFVLRGSNEDRLTVVGYAEGSERKSYIDAAGFTEESLETLYDSVKAVTEINPNVYKASTNGYYLGKNKKEDNPETKRDGTRLTVILIGKEYEAHDLAKDNKEVHTVKKWEDILREKEIWYRVRIFDSTQRLNAYISAVSDVEDYLSDDFYTFGIIMPEFIKNE